MYNHDYGASFLLKKRIYAPFAQKPMYCLLYTIPILPIFNSDNFVEKFICKLSRIIIISNNLIQTVTMGWYFYNSLLLLCRGQLT